jgi:outer membrane protein, multidrug efflux system
MKMDKIFHIALIFIIFVSCTFQPPVPIAVVNVPSEWRFQASEESVWNNIRWWEQFEDPVLSDLIKEALENNRDLKVAIDRIYQFAALLGIARSQLYPQIDLTGSAVRQELSIDVSPLPLGFRRITNEYTYLFNLSYEVDIWGKVRSAVDSAYADLRGSIYIERGVVLTLISAVATSYIQLRQFDKQYEVAKETVQSRTDSYKLAKLRYEEGLTSELEVFQAESEIENAAAQMVQYEILIPQQEDLLSVLLGRAPGTIERGDLLSEIKLPPVVPAGLPSSLLEQRPDLLAAEESLISANAQIGVAVANFFPQISLTGFYGGESLELRHLFTKRARTWLWGGNFVQPLFTGWLLTNQLREAEAITLEALHSYESAILNAFKEVDDALIAHEKSKELFEIQTKRVSANTNYLYLAILRYNNGQTDYLNVLDAERNLFNSQLDYVSAQANCFLTIIALYKALGGSWLCD